MKFGVLPLLLVFAGCGPLAPGDLFAPSAERCKTKGCRWADKKAERLELCQARKPEGVVQGAECMGEFISYYGTKACTNTRAWLSRLHHGIAEDGGPVDGPVASPPESTVAEP